MVVQVMGWRPVRVAEPMGKCQESFRFSRPSFGCTLDLTAVTIPRCDIHQWTAGQGIKIDIRKDGVPG